MKKLLIVIMAMLLIIPTALACYPGKTCDPWIIEYSIDPCNANNVNRTSPIQIKINATGCPTGDNLPEFTCKIGWQSYKSNFWNTMIPVWGWDEENQNINWEALDICNKAHYMAYCDNVSAMVIIYDNNNTIKYQTAWSDYNTGYRGGSGDTAILFDTTDLSPGFNWTGTSRIVMKVKTTNITKDSYVIKVNYTIANDASIHYGTCKLSNIKVPDFVPDDNRLVNSMNAFSYGGTFAYTMLIVIVAITMFLTISTRTRKEDSKMAAGVTLAVVMLLIIIGAYLRLIDWVILAVFFTIVAAYIVKKVRDMF